MSFFLRENGGERERSGEREGERKGGKSGEREGEGERYVGKSERERIMNWEWVNGKSVCEIERRATPLIDRTEYVIPFAFFQRYLLYLLDNYFFFLRKFIYSEIWRTIAGARPVGFWV